jgi:DNA-binding NtrC family response regulator
MRINSMSCDTSLLGSEAKQWDSRFFSQSLKPLSTPRYLVLIDDDPSFLAIMKRLADSQGVRLDCFENLDDLLIMDVFKKYDAAILDYDLGDQTGIDISQYIYCFVKEIPTLIISAKDRTAECRDIPRCVRSVLRKSAGYQYILELAVSLSHQDEDEMM